MTTTYTDDRADDRPLMLVHLDPLEYDVWTSLCVAAKRDDQGKLRVGCPDDEKVLFENWASSSLECSPEQYMECFQRFVDAGIIGNIGRAEGARMTTYVFHVEPDTILAIPIWRHFSTWLDPAVYDALEAVQKRFSARFGSKVLCDDVAKLLRELKIADGESKEYALELFGHILNPDDFQPECDTTWSSRRQMRGEDRLILCHPDFMGYSFTRSFQHPWERHFRPVPSMKTIDLSGMRLIRLGLGGSSAAVSCPEPLDTAAPSGRERPTGCAGIPAALVEAYGNDDLKRYFRDCDPHTIDEIDDRAATILNAARAERSRREAIHKLTNKCAEIAEHERSLRVERERLESEIAALEA